MLAVGTASIAASFALIIGATPTLLLLLMAYLFSYGAYTINRSSEIDQDALSNPTRTKLLEGRKSYLPMIAIAYFGLGYALAATVNTIFFAALLVPLLLALAYSVGSKRLERYLGAKRLKDRLLLKNLVVAFGWSLIPLLVALYYLDLRLAVLTFGGFVFLRLMTNTIVFDARDVEADSKFGVRTIPVAFGKSSAFRLMLLIDLAAIVYLAAVISFGLFPIYASVLLVLPLYSIYYRHLAQRPGANLGRICDLIADGEYLLWGPVLYLGRILF
jgi:4-hydroxybenzoate polyprenyltransferase